MSGHSRIILGLVIIILQPAILTGCSQGNKNSVSDDQYQKLWGRKGDPPPKGFDEYMKTNGPNAPRANVPQNQASKK